MTSRNVDFRAPAHTVWFDRVRHAGWHVFSSTASAAASKPHVAVRRTCPEIQDPPTRSATLVTAAGHPVVEEGGAARTSKLVAALFGNPIRVGSRSSPSYPAITATAYVADIR